MRCSSLMALAATAREYSSIRSRLSSAEYAAVAPMEAFIATQGERHPTDLAGLRGARLVTSQETEEGRRWAESKIKALTGGDPITARFMRQNFFTYQPAFKLVIAGNHKPGLRGVDEAIRRRFHLIPVHRHDRKPGSRPARKARAEWPGILAWMTQGCLHWQHDGLNPPEIVREATEAYLAEEDAPPAGSRIAALPAGIIGAPASFGELAALGDGCEEIGSRKRSAWRSKSMDMSPSELRIPWLFRARPEGEREAEPLLAARLLCRSARLSVGS